jgi:hypothetical protein
MIVRAHYVAPFALGPGTPYLCIALMNAGCGMRCDGQHRAERKP